MAMKESEGSLRAYFVIVGLLSVALALHALSIATKVHAPARLLLALWFPIVTHLALGAAFVVAGLRLNAALRGDPRWILRLLVLAAVAQLGQVILAGAFLGAEKIGASVGALVIGLALTAYLYASVSRLAREAKQRTAAMLT